jgi:hypothetical protein
MINREHFPGNTMKIIYLLYFLFFLNCSTTFQKKQDYIPSTNALQAKEYKKAVKLLPNSEGKSFIHTMELSYLQLIQGKPEIDELIKYAQKIENRLRYSASREIKTFFYLETPEGYYASEHEIIWMHMLLSWGYSLREDYEKAYIEAKKSSTLLSNHWSEEGRFDDAFLRVVLSVLWTLCGHWEEAQVDLRVAYSIDPSLKWAGELAERTEPPGDFLFLLGGVGPEPIWDPSLNLNLLRGARSLRFESTSQKSKLTLLDSEEKTWNLQLTPDSSNWYKRHLIRDNAIQDLIADSKYGQNLLATTLKESGRSVASLAGGITIGVASVAAGGGLIYMAVQCNCGELSGAMTGLGFAIMAGGVRMGYDLVETSLETSAENFRETADISDDYRYVRFLPEYAWVAYSQDKMKYPLRITKSSQKVLEISKPINSSILSIDHIPDSKLEK